MKIVSFSKQILNLNFVCNLPFVLLSIRYLLERFVYLKSSQISVPMITLNVQCPCLRAIE